MKCPHCGYTSFDDLDHCKKCSRDLQQARARLGLRTHPGTRRRQPSSPLAESVPEPSPQESAALDFGWSQPVAVAAAAVNAVESPSAVAELPPLPLEPPLLPERPPTPAALPVLPRVSSPLEPWGTDPGSASETLAWPGLATTSRDEAGRLESWLALEGQTRHFPAPQLVPGQQDPELPFGGAQPAVESTVIAAAAKVVPVGLRLLALLLDLAGLSLLFALFVVAGSLVLPGVEGDVLFSANALLNRATPYFLLLFALCFGYFTVFHALLGQTPGKMLTGLCVVDGQGLLLTPAQAFLRSAGGLLCLLPVGLGFIWIAFAGEHLGWNDRLAGSRVVRVGSDSAPAEEPADTEAPGDA